MTEIDADYVIGALGIDGEDGDVYVVDQYGIYFSDELVFRITDVEESSEGYAENNFKVTNNDTDEIAVDGAERADTFTLVVSYALDQSISETTSVTVGADTMATIVNGYNTFKEELLPILEEQRQNGLG